MATSESKTVKIDMSIENYRFICDRISKSENISIDDVVNSIVRESRYRSTSIAPISPSDLELAVEALGAGMKPDNVLTLIKNRSNSKK